jgi:hypothetical protein
MQDAAESMYLFDIRPLPPAAGMFRRRPATTSAWQKKPENRLDSARRHLAIGWQRRRSTAASARIRR